MLGGTGETCSVISHRTRAFQLAGRAGLHWKVVCAVLRSHAPSPSAIALSLLFAPAASNAKH